MKIFHILSYLALRLFLFPFSLLSYSFLHILGEKMGTVAFYLLPKYRKRILSNLSLASDLILEEKDKKTLAKRVLGNLFIVCLEYGKLCREKNIKRLVTCVNPEKAQNLLQEHKGLIFFCGHQANWELFFLEGTSRMPGTAIGQSIQNTYLYNWILQIREKFGGKIILPSQAVKEGLRALKQERFLGIVGDQAMPGSGFCSPFLGRNAWTSSLPALLSYRSKKPIITAIMTRKGGKYLIQYSDPIFPNTENPSEKEIPLMMEQVLKPLEESIKKAPDQWLWSHNRWKQQKPGRLKKAYRQDAIAVLLPKDPVLWKSLVKEISLFKGLYPTELLSFFTPYPLLETIDAEVFLYSDYNDLKIRDFRYKLLFNFTSQNDLNKHFLRLAVLKVVTLPFLQKKAKSSSTALHILLPKVLLHAG
jgi:KDO2-lipid IV(A) lauroyltransferase